MSLFEGPTAPSVEHLGLLTTTLQDALVQSVSPRPGEPEIIRTLGDLKPVLRRALPEGKPMPCLSQRAFYGIRAGLIRERGIARNDVRPDTPWRRVVQRWGLADTWKRIGRVAGFRMPRLEYAVWAKALLISGIACASAAIFVSALRHSGTMLWRDAVTLGWLSIVPAVAALALWAFTWPAHWYLPRAVTVGDAASAVTRFPDLLRRQGEGWSDALISRHVDGIVEEIFEPSFDDDLVVWDRDRRLSVPGLECELFGRAVCPASSL